MFMSPNTIEPLVGNHQSFGGHLKEVVACLQEVRPQGSNVGFFGLWQF